MKISDFWDTRYIALLYFKSEYGQVFWYFTVGRSAPKAKEYIGTDM